jgi:hypothetical protein
VTLKVRERGRDVIVKVRGLKDVRKKEGHDMTLKGRMRKYVIVKGKGRKEVIVKGRLWKDVFWKGRG